MYDVIIVLGASVNPDGSLSERLRNRVDKAIMLFRAGKAEKMIFTGKHSFKLELAGQTPLRTEAQAMADYALSKGIPSSAVYLEEHSKDTVGNALFVKTSLLEPKGWKKVMVITSEYHVDKAKLLFDFILGPDYQIEYASVEAVKTSEEIADWKKRQEPIIAKIKDRMKGIAPGDTESIRRALLSDHPAYL